MKNIFITKARNDENTKENNFVLSNFRIFVINPALLPIKRDLRFAPTGLPGLGSWLVVHSTWKIRRGV
jgi:hypothetical protein